MSQDDNYSAAQPAPEGEPPAPMEESPVSGTPAREDAPAAPPKRRLRIRPGPRAHAVFLLLAFVAGLGSGYLAWGRGAVRPKAADLAAVAKQINPPQGFTLPARYGGIGPRMLEAGAINGDKFVQLYEQNKQPLSEEQLAILRQGMDTPIVISAANSYFLLNFFWAFGLVNKNPLLETKFMMPNGKMGEYASTSGWTVGAKSPDKIYDSVAILSLLPEQQARLEEVAMGVYRPCCGNPTSFPDCNHGMALLGMLELMASQGATVDQMFTAAKQVNSFWFPQQALEVATYFKASENRDFQAIDPRRFVDADTFSGNGFRKVHQWLADKGLLQQNPSAGGGCGV